MVHGQTLAAHQHQQPAIAELAADRRQFAHAGAHGRIVGPITAIAHRGPVGPEHRTRPPFAHLEHVPHVSDGLSPGGGRHHFFAATSLSMALSSIASASWSIPFRGDGLYPFLEELAGLRPFV